MKTVARIVFILLVAAVSTDALAKGKKKGNNKNNNSAGNQFNKRISGLKRQIKETEKDLVSNQKKIDEAASGKSTSHAFSGSESLEKRRKSLETILERYKKRLEEAEEDKQKAVERGRKNNNNKNSKKKK